jgi:nicotinamide-nucleotide amidase
MAMAVPSAPSDEALAALAAQAGRALLSSRLRLVAAESCTGGWIAKCLTDTAGSSQWFERGYVTYSNLAKEQSLGVGKGALEEHGAVSAVVAEQMARGALQRSDADIAIAVTGIAGPDGGSAEKPVGLVWFALVERSMPVHLLEQHFTGDREGIRRAAVATALLLVLSAAASTREDRAGPAVRA